VTDPLGNSFTFNYGASFLLDSIGFPGNVVERFYYDADSRVRARSAGETLARDARGKLLRRTVSGSNTVYSYYYSGIGNLRAVEHWSGTTMVRGETYSPDALGNSRTVDIFDPGAAGIGGESSNQFIRAYDSGRGSFAGQQHFETSSSASYGWQPENDSQYDGDGNLVAETSYGYKDIYYCNCPPVPATVVTNKYSSYDANNKLRFIVASTTTPYTTGDSTKSTTLEYRYDALGRRIAVRYRGPHSCRMDNNPQCRSFDDRQYWVGDQLLAETRTMENGYSGTQGPGFDGSVVYTHGLGIDRPLSMHRVGLCQFTAFPHTNFLGQLQGETYAGTAPSCASIYWAADASAPYRSRSIIQANAPWNGSLADQSSDASGLQYMRNRYYNPTSGQFTQADPIGLAGGLNFYGYSGGDPVNYSDPFGLVEVKFLNEESRLLYEQLRTNAQNATKSKDQVVAAAGRKLLATLDALEADDEVVTVAVQKDHGNGFGPRLPRGRGLGWGISLDPSTETNYGMQLKLAHELGHAYTTLIGGLDPEAKATLPIGNASSLTSENQQRTIWHCPYRNIHDTSPWMRSKLMPACP
jgi:RHS repeat-associated protein